MLTLDDIAQLNRERMNALGVSPKMRTVELTVMRMMSYMGELSTLCYRSTSLSGFEQEEVGMLLGSLLISVATLGEMFKVNVSDCAVQRINQHLSRHDILRRDSLSHRHVDGGVGGYPMSGGGGGGGGGSGGGSEGSSRTPSVKPSGDDAFGGPPNHLQDDHAIVPVVDAELLLSPATRRKFFPQLDAACSFPPDRFNQLKLTWTAPEPSGRIIELIPNGSEIYVTHDRLQEYLNLVRPLRLLHDAENHFSAVPPIATLIPPAVAARMGTSGAAQQLQQLQPAQQQHLPDTAVTRHVDVPRPPGYDAHEVEKMFSPTHFEYGLFSPHSNATALDVQYPAETVQTQTDPVTNNAAVAGRGTLSAGLGSPSPTVPPTVDAPVAVGASATPPPPPLSGQPNSQSRSEVEFLSLVNSLEKGEVQGSKITSLRLKFAVPSGDGRVVELVAGGAHVPVTAANVDEFLKLVRQQQQFQQSHGGKVRRTESIKRLELSGAVGYDPTAERQKFSPTHFPHTIFAPHEDRTQFFVDYDHEEDCLPEALRDRPPPSTGLQEKQTAAPSVANMRPRESSVPSLTSLATATVTTTSSSSGNNNSLVDPPAPVGTDYVSYLRSAGAEGLRGVMNQVERNVGALKRFGVTWCIPSVVVGIQTEDPIFDLIVNGRNVLVSESHASLFLAMVRKYL